MSSAKLQELLLRYGKVGIGVHLCLSTVSIGTCYVAIRRQLPVDELLERCGLPVDNSTAASGGTAVAAFVLHKSLMPLRVPVQAIQLIVAAPFEGAVPARICGIEVDQAMNSVGRPRRGKARSGKPRSGSTAADDDVSLASGAGGAMMALAADGVEALDAAKVTPLEAPPGTPSKQTQQQIGSPTSVDYGALPTPLLSVPSPVRVRGMLRSGEPGSVMATSPSTSCAPAPQQAVATDTWQSTPVAAPMQHHPGGGYREYLRAVGTQAMHRTEYWRVFSQATLSPGPSNVLQSPTHCGSCPTANLGALMAPPSSQSCSVMDLVSMQPPPPPTPPAAVPSPLPIGCPLPTTPHAMLHHQHHGCSLPTTPHSVQHHSLQQHLLQQGVAHEMMHQSMPGIVSQPHIDCVQNLATLPTAEHVQVPNRSPEQAMMDSIGEIGGLSTCQLAAKLCAAAQCVYDD